MGLVQLEDQDQRAILVKTEGMELMENQAPQGHLAIEENLEKMVYLEFRVFKEKKDRQDCQDLLVCQVTKDRPENRVIRVFLVQKDREVM